MNIYQLRVKLLCDGKTEKEIEQLLDEMAQQRNDNQRDQEAEAHYEHIQTNAGSAG